MLKDESYSVTNMFDLLRLSATAECASSSTVFELRTKGISCHWFTATPNVKESVFKPFVFAPSPKISPLTVITDDERTLLCRLHAQRRLSAVKRLKNLESECVCEIQTFLSKNPESNDELNELMKDCVEAEVKFYR